MTISLQQRLDKSARAAAFSTADLALWFDLPYATIRSYREGTEPYETRRPQIEQRLQWLERAVDKDSQLPIPLTVRASRRKEYILGVFNRVRRNR